MLLPKQNLKSLFPFRVTFVWTEPVPISSPSPHPDLHLHLSIAGTTWTGSTTWPSSRTRWYQRSKIYFNYTSYWPEGKLHCIIYLKWNITTWFLNQLFMNTVFIFLFNLLWALSTKVTTQLRTCSTNTSLVRKKLDFFFCYKYLRSHFCCGNFLFIFTQRQLVYLKDVSCQFKQNAEFFST